MHFLIDGYNLLFALGLPLGRTGPSVLEKARLRLLQFLQEAHGADSRAVTVVFDAANRRHGETVQDFQGIGVRFAVGYPEADDLIEELIRNHPAPPKLTVVSDDHRLQTGARRRQCVVLGCGEYLDWLDARRRPAPPAESPPPAKPETVSGEETQRWLREFGDLADDPEFRELFDPLGVEDLLEGEEDW